ncbi:class II fructose-bisphosphate aldolase [Streptomyces sp. MNU89]|uniref:class II fructose-bisphosphate aldolase n=1 Tax=Streptomyces sp. MNU89 TaxID=2560025 RepID=UPI001E41972B|nr:class II fructose-bisphosphate aldolase [Streptomyces sp. MNU89]MCC9738241.1 class II fructose-bisphosphate aldolase [Streptomyces sp. MNU89]
MATLSTLLTHAFHRPYAVPAFNVTDLASVQGVLDAAERTSSPVILQFSERVARALGPRTIAAFFRSMTEHLPVPAALHLDHCRDAGLAMEALRCSWNSVLYDASDDDFEDGLRTTAALVSTARAHGADIEGEFERIGRLADGHGAPDDDSAHDRALEFIRRTGVTCFSPDVGTLHGDYTGPPTIHTRRIARLASASGVPQVLHGASGIPPETLHGTLELGVAKVNFSTALKHGHRAAVTAFMAGSGSRPWDPLRLHQTVRASVSERAERCIGTVASAGHAC